MQSKSTASESPFKGDVPIDIPSWTFDSNDVQSKSDMLFSCSTPPSSLAPLNLQTINGSADTLIFTNSMADDLENVLELKESEFKGVNFLASSPQQISYVVSHSKDEMDMRVPEPLFPNQKSLSPTAHEVVQKSKSLEIAASKAVVKKKNSNENEKEKEKKQKKKKKFEFNATRKRNKIIQNNLSSVTSPRTSKFIALYIEQCILKNVKFDKISVTGSNQKVVLLSSKALTTGNSYEWSFQILRSDVDLQVRLFALLVLFAKDTLIYLSIP